MIIPADMAAIRGLQKYLQDNVPELKKVYDEWPNPKQEMKLPCASVITAGTPTYMNYSNFIIHSKSQDPEIPQNDIIVEKIGQFDATIQLDIWCEYKIQRGRIFDLIDNALNKDYLEKGIPQGLSLTLADYHNIIARYDQVGYTYIDNEENSQKSQWRMKIDLVVNYSKVAVKSVPRIEEATINHQISDNSDVSEDNEELEENIQIF
jgi:hypothetical protein